MPPRLPKSVYFKRAVSSSAKKSWKYKKYVAYLPNGKTVAFGDVRYQHYKDQVPVKAGGGRYKHLDHLDKKRRQNYRKRHRGVLTKNGTPAYQVRYSPSWFSYHFLW